MKIERRVKGKKIEQQQGIIRERRVKGNRTDKSKWEHKDRAAAWHKKRRT